MPKPKPPEPQLIYIVVVVDAYIPEAYPFKNREEAVAFAKASAWSGEAWTHEKISDHGEIYFNQKEEGDMEEAVSVQERSVK